MKQVRSLHYRMQHGKRTLVEVKQLRKEMKQLEETREKVRANDIEMNRDFCQQRDAIYQTFKFGLVGRFRYQVMLCLTKLYWDFIGVYYLESNDSLCLVFTDLFVLTCSTWVWIWTQLERKSNYLVGELSMREN